MAEDLLDDDPYSIADDLGLQKAVPMTIKDIRQLDTAKKKKWFDATVKEMNSLIDKKTFTGMAAKEVYDTFWRHGVKTKNLPARMVYVKKSQILISLKDGKRKQGHVVVGILRTDHGKWNWEIEQRYQMHAR